jgi:AraC-like DNA-binding protein
MLGIQRGTVMHMDVPVRNEARRWLAPWQVRRAIQLLIEATSTACPVTTLAAACGLSRSHFAHAFRATTGVPPHKWLLLHRIRCACELMERTDRCLADIAQSCGFADQSHFSRTFRALMDRSPAMWRRERRCGVTAAELDLAGPFIRRASAAVGFGG